MTATQVRCDSCGFTAPGRYPTPEPCPNRVRVEPIGGVGQIVHWDPAGITCTGMLRQWQPYTPTDRTGVQR